MKKMYSFVVTMVMSIVMMLNCVSITSAQTLPGCGVDLPAQETVYWSYATNYAYAQLSLNKVISHISGIEIMDEEQALSYDFKKDGVLNLSDLAIISKIAKSKIYRDPFKVNVDTLTLMQDLIEEGMYIDLYDFDANGKINNNDFNIAKAFYEINTFHIISGLGILEMNLAKETALKDGLWGDTLHFRIIGSVTMIPNYSIVIHMGEAMYVRRSGNGLWELNLKNDFSLKSCYITNKELGGKWFYLA